MIVTRRDGYIATIAFDRPAARNALSSEGWDQLAEAIARIGDDVAAVILASDVTGIFSAGADLAMLGMLTTDVPARAAFREQMHRAVEGIAELPMPVIAAVDGGCYGAAVALTLACDLCVGGDGAVFATTPAKLGIGYPGSDVARLIAKIGRGQASRMLFTAETISVDEAHRIGLADLRAPSAIDAAREIAQRIAANAPEAVRLLKRTIADPADSDGDFDAAFGGDAFVTRLAEFQARPR